MEAQKLTYNLKVVPKYVSSITTYHLGSICQIIKPNGTVVEKTNYDPWGRVRNADTWTYPTSESVSQSHALTTTYRGYTGHEHLPHFALINMNGRMYDPVVGRMLSPDNYVQSPNNPQNYNRYAYVLNNPLKYTDPSGEIVGSVITLLWEGLKAIEKSAINVGRELFLEGGLDITSREARRQAWADMDPTANTQTGNIWAMFDPTTSGNKTNNALKIDAGLFMHIPGWETSQTLLGNVISHGRNLNGKVDNVEINRGTVLVNDNDPNDFSSWGMTFGPYINSNRINVGSPLYRHELGHTIQSRFLGPLYISKVAIPSGISAFYSYNYLNDYSYGNYHDKTWYEVNATILGDVPNYYNIYRSNSFWYWAGVVLLPFFPY